MTVLHQNIPKQVILNTHKQTNIRTAVLFSGVSDDDDDDDDDFPL